MRKILFRGRTVSESEYLDDGEWIEGAYTCFNGEEHRIYTGYAETDCGDYYPDWFNVIPETVGQFTGFTDKNGAKIFEGDIVKIDNKYIRYIEYSGECAGFVKFRYIDELTSEFSGYLGKGYDNYKQTVEVIGNIYDNPELLKGGDDQ